MVGISTTQIKQLNRELVLRALKGREAATKDEIARDTGLSGGTCRTILNELLETGEAREIALADSTGGRPSRRYIYNPNHAYMGLLYPRMEGEETTVFATVLNMAGECLYENINSYEEIGLEEIDGEIEVLRSVCPSLSVLAMGIPGVVRGGMSGLCDLEKLSHLPLVSYLSEKWGLPVSLENDVNCAALGFYHHQKPPRSESLSYIYYPRHGMAGAGIVVDGKVVRGANNFAGEISHLPREIERPFQGPVQENRIVFSELVVNTILSINCVINPEQIILTGEAFGTVLRRNIESLLKETAPEGHCPRLSFEEDLHLSYIKGLQFMAMRRLSCGFELISYN